MAPPISVSVDMGGNFSERLVNQEVLEGAARVAGSDPGLMVELLATARIAARRGDKRRAIIDVATFAEAALTRLLGFDSNHTKTLGALVLAAQQSGIPIPNDTASELVTHRNDAAHRAQVVAKSVNRALELVEELVCLADQSIIRVGSMSHFNRPQRCDLLMVLPPSAEAIPPERST